MWGKSNLKKKLDLFKRIETTWNNFENLEIKIKI